MTTLHGLADIRRYFRGELPPLFYISKTPYNALGLTEWIPSFSYVAEADFFDGHAPGMFAPSALDGDALPATFEQSNQALLTHPEVERFIRSKGPGGKALFLMFDEGNERSARRVGLEVAFPPAALRARLDDKLETTRIGDEAGIRSVPNVRVRVDGYDTLRRVSAHLGQDLVIQLPLGDSGQTTFFVSDERTYRAHAEAIEAEREVKVMRRIVCRQAAIEACVTRHGVVVGPLATELVGFPELTPYAGGWCGNEIAQGALPDAVVATARDMTGRFGRALAHAGYRGYFGLDFLLDEASGEVFLGELNPRVTGVAPLTTQIANEVETVPLFLLHLLEWLDVGYEIDVDELNARWAELGSARSWSQLIIKRTAAAGSQVRAVPPSGRYRKNAAGIVHVSHDPTLGALAGADEALVVRTLQKGWRCGKGDCIARLVTPARVMTPDYRLAPRTLDWIDAVRRQFDFGAESARG